MFDTYLNIDGIKGESQDDKHKDWIEITSFSHGITQPVSVTRSSAGGASTGRTQHGDFVITKFLDAATPKLNEAASQGKHIGKVKLEVCRAGGNQVKFYEITMEEVMISHVGLNSHGHGTSNGASASAGDGSDSAAMHTYDLPTETVHLNYGKIEWVYTQQKRKDGSGGGNVSAKYDLTAGKS